MDGLEELAFPFKPEEYYCLVANTYELLSHQSEYDLPLYFDDLSDLAKRQWSEGVIKYTKSIRHRNDSYNVEFEHLDLMKQVANATSENETELKGFIDFLIPKNAINTSNDFIQSLLDLHGNSVQMYLEAFSTIVISIPELDPDEEVHSIVCIV